MSLFDKQKTIFVIGCFSLLLYLELGFFHFLGFSEDLYSALSILKIVLFPVILVTLFVTPIISLCFALVNDRPVLMEITDNKIAAERLDNINFYENATADFSGKHELVENKKIFVDAATKVIVGCCAKQKLNLSPYVIFTSQRDLSANQIDLIKSALFEAGAVDVAYIGKNATAKQAWSFIKENRVRMFHVSCK